MYSSENHEFSRKAQLWKTSIVNHLWLEACVSSWTWIDVTQDPIYQTFPEMTTTVPFENVAMISSPFKLIEDKLIGENQSKAFPIPLGNDFSKTEPAKPDPKDHIELEK